VTKAFDSVFDALADTPADAANLTARADLLLSLRERVKAWGVSQEQAAKRLGLTLLRLNDLLGGKLDKFSLDALIDAATAAGLRLQDSGCMFDPKKRHSRQNSARSNGKA